MGGAVPDVTPGPGIGWGRTYTEVARKARAMAVNLMVNGCFMVGCSESAYFKEAKDGRRWMACGDEMGWRRTDESGYIYTDSSISSWLVLSPVF